MAAVLAAVVAAVLAAVFAAVFAAVVAAAFAAVVAAVFAAVVAAVFAAVVAAVFAAAVAAVFAAVVAAVFAALVATVFAAVVAAVVAAVFAAVVAAVLADDVATPSFNPGFLKRRVSETEPALRGPRNLVPSGTFNVFFTVWLAEGLTLFFLPGVRISPLVLLGLPNLLDVKSLLISFLVSVSSGFLDLFCGASIAVDLMVLSDGFPSLFLSFFSLELGCTVLILLRFDLVFLEVSKDLVSIIVEI